jgi:hypothetical protein
VRQIIPFLANNSVPVPTRVSAAARVLRVIPDKPRPVRQIVRALTTDLSPSRALDRLRQIQHQLEKSRTLDELIDARERRVKLACPRCRIKLPRVEMIKHLWHKHGLTFSQGKTRSTQRRIADLRGEHSATGNAAPLDSVAEFTGAAGLREWLAADELPAEEVSPLVAVAKEHGAGLCPGCFTEVPAAVAPLPPLLVLANGRLAGEGYAVGVRGNAWVRTLAVSTPEHAAAGGRRRLAPRFIATLAAALVLGLALLAPTRSLTLAGIPAAVIVYIGMRRVSLPRAPNDQALDCAWERIAPNLVEREKAARFLTRLCLSSLGAGNPELRSRVLTMIVARASGHLDDSDTELKLFAAACVLQIEDSVRFGRDVAAGIATLASTGFSSERSADFAEYVVAAFLMRERDDGELARLRILLLAAAFEAGLVPRDLLMLWAGAPNLKRAMAVEPTHRLGLLFGLWQAREAQAWHSVGHGNTVFELTRRFPRTASGVLARFPDLLLYHRPEREVEDLIGPVLVCARGVAVAGNLTADPDADVRLARGGRELIFGHHHIEVPTKLPADLPEMLRKWLQFRAEALVPFIDGYRMPGSKDIAKHVLGPFCRRCLRCGTVSVMGCGAIGRRV